MYDQLDKTLHWVAEEVFASLAFMLPRSPEEPDIQYGEACNEMSAVSIEFTGPLNGALVVAIGGEVLEELATNMLGLDENCPPPADDRQRDALGELANVICGNLLTAIWGEEATCTIDPPHLLEQDMAVEMAYSGRPAATVRLNLARGHAQVTLFCDETSADCDAAIVTTDAGRRDEGE